MRGVLLLSFVLLVATACGEEEQAARACAPPPSALVGAPTLLPTGFPMPTGVTYTSENRAGPSKIVKGYLKDDIGAAFKAYKRALSTNGYVVAKSEKEEDDAEVNFASAHSTGQVKLVQECQGRTMITITARPA